MKTSISLPLTAALTLLLAACPQSGSDDTKKELAALKEQLAQQQQQDAARTAREQEQQQRQREEDIYRQAQEDMKLQQEMEEQEKKQAEKAKREAQAAAKAKITEKLARYQAVVISESGFGSLNLRGTPSTSGVVITQLSDGREVQVIAETSVCQNIGKTSGCWVKVRTREGVTGYLLNAYLQKTGATDFSEEDDV